MFRCVRESGILRRIILCQVRSSGCQMIDDRSRVLYFLWNQEEILSERGVIYVLGRRTLSVFLTTVQSPRRTKRRRSSQLDLTSNYSET